MIYQYKCLDCLSVFDHMDNHDITCVSCKSNNVDKNENCIFAPNKFYCPHGVEFDKTQIVVDMGSKFTSSSAFCAGCLKK